MPLRGAQLKAVAEALLDAFSLAAFDRLLLYALDLHRERLSVGGDLTEVVFVVTRELNRQERVPELIAAAAACCPGNTRLATVAADLLTTPLRAHQIPGLERLLSGDRGRLFPAGEWHVRMGTIQRCVARVELTNDGPLATAFLIGPDVALTNHHVLAPFITGRADPARVRLRLDVVTSDDHAPVSSGVTYGLAGDWLIDASPPSAAELRGLPGAEDPSDDELDFVAVRLDGAPGHEPVTATSAVPGAPERGWLRGAAAPGVPAPGDPMFILQHPRGTPLRLAFDRVIAGNASGTRIRHAVDTEPGSSGSPCFDRNLELVAIHHGGDPAWPAGNGPAFNQAVPIAPILRRLADRDRSHV